MFYRDKRKIQTETVDGQAIVVCHLNRPKSFDQCSQHNTAVHILRCVHLKDNDIIGTMKILSSTVAALCTLGLALSSGHYAEAAAATRGRASSGAVIHRHGGSSVHAGNGGKFGSLPVSPQHLACRALVKK